MEPTEDQVEVYRGTDVSTLALIEDMLTAEGFEPERLGRASPALVGVGIAALMQRIVVPRAHADEARALVERMEAERDATDDSELEAEAMRASQPRDHPSAGQARALPPLRPATLAFLIAIAILVVWWLR